MAWVARNLRPIPVLAAQSGRRYASDKVLPNIFRRRLVLAGIGATAAVSLSYAMTKDSPGLGRRSLNETEVWINGGGFSAFWWDFGYWAAVYELHGRKGARKTTGYSAGVSLVRISCPS